MNLTTTIKDLEAEAHAQGGGTRHLTARRGRYVVGGVVSATARLGDNLAGVVSTLTQAIADTTADTVGSWLISIHAPLAGSDRENGRLRSKK